MAMRVTQRVSTLRILPRIMLVRVDRSATQDWGLDELDIEVLRVRHPLPACARMVVTRPAAPVAWVVGRDGFADGPALIRHARTLLPPVMIPLVVRFVSSLPATSNGKLLRRAPKLAPAARQPAHYREARPSRN